MKIQIETPKKNRTISIPDCLLSPKRITFLVKMVGRMGNDRTVEQIPAEVFERIFAELRDINRKYGSWELVEIDSAKGERIRITL